MSMLSSQADELRTLADKLRIVSLDERTNYVENVGTLYRAMGAMREAADTIESLRDRLEETQGAGIGECEIECFDDGVDEGMDGEWFTYAPPTWHLSCGHKVFGDERPNFCSHCGAKVVDA